MRVSTYLKLTGVAATYLLWLVSYVVLAERAFGPGSYYWAETLVVSLTALVAFWTVTRVGRPYPVFLVILGCGLLLLAVTSTTYQRCPPIKLPGKGAPEVWAVSYAGFLYLWICAWGYFAVDRWRHQPPSTLTIVVFALLTLGLGAVVANFYYPEYASWGTSIPDRLNAVIAVLEFAALAVGLACVLLGVPAALTWMVFAMAVLAASDILYTDELLPEHVVGPVWMSGLFLLLSALLVLPDALTQSGQAPEKQVSTERSARLGRSGLSGILLLLSLGAVLLSAAVGLAPPPPSESSPDQVASAQSPVDPCAAQSTPVDARSGLSPSTESSSSLRAPWKAFFSVLFIVTLVIAMVWITDRFDETVAYLRSYMEKLHRQRLEGDEWREISPRIRSILHSTGLGKYLDALRDSAQHLKRDVVFLGPERLYPPPKAPRGDGRVRCFIVMPFSLEWSNDVHRIVAEACKAAGVLPVRGDDLFTPTDILDDIWQGINGADFVVADITGRNANVMYELGIAHTLAKPVLILSRTGADIPIDLSTRRVVLYGQPENEWRESLQEKVSKAIGEILATYGLRPASAESGRLLADGGESQSPRQTGNDTKEPDKEG